MITALLIWAGDPVPEAKDVVAGPWGALLVGAFIAAGVFLAFSFLKQMRKVQAAREAGVFGDEPEGSDSAE